MSDQFSKYIEYEVEDFVEDKNFRKWIVSCDIRTDLYWKAVLKEIPDKVEDINSARKIIKLLYFEEQQISNEKIELSFGRLNRDVAKRQSIRVHRIQLTNWIVKAAAVLLIPVLLFNLYYFTYRVVDRSAVPMVRYVVPSGEKSNLILPDGTKVYLNSNSELSFSPDINESYRSVFLEGEAFFDVTKDKTKPFIVKTKNYDVRVYGTKFNLRTNYGTYNNEVILEEGVISLTSIKGHDGEIKMTPGDRFSLKDDNHYSISKVDPKFYSIWKDNVLRISNEPLKDLVVRMERWYGVVINIKDFERVKDIRYTLTIKTESLREMLELMRYVTPFKYNIDGENVTLVYEK